MPLNATQLAAHLGVSRSRISHALRDQERARQQGRAYEGRVPEPSGYHMGKPYWVIHEKEQ